ncbi:MAG: nuclear transport factor 2 family protein [Deltaproteobacteria bacterium]|nr:nuclear transport factor 2 family protein [Deltaproteobacteria bacterium]
MPKVLVIALAMVAAMSGCRSGRSDAVKTLDAYSQALERKDYDAAYGMMSEEYRAQHSRDQFVDLLEQNSGEVKETAKRLRGQSAEVEVFAEFNYGLGDSMRLVREDGVWKIASNPSQFYSQASPREALRSFVRAYQAKRWDVMLRYVPKRYRERMTKDTVRKQFDGERREEIAAMMKQIAAHLDEPITVNGAEARMPYAERYEVVFRREDDGWKISDLD